MQHRIPDLLTTAFFPREYAGLAVKIGSKVYYLLGWGESNPTDAVWGKGAIFINRSTGAVYRNTADDGQTPSWTAM